MQYISNFFTTSRQFRLSRLSFFGYFMTSGVLLIAISFASIRQLFSSFFSSNTSDLSLNVAKVIPSKNIFDRVFGDKFGFGVLWGLMGVFFCYFVWVILNTKIQQNNKQVIKSEYVGSIDYDSITRDIYSKIVLVSLPIIWFFALMLYILPLASSGFANFVLKPASIYAIGSLIFAQLLVFLAVVIAHKLYVLAKSAY
jgi:hypothetical protein